MNKTKPKEEQLQLIKLAQETSFFKLLKSLFRLTSLEYNTTYNCIQCNIVFRGKSNIDIERSFIFNKSGFIKFVSKLKYHATVVDILLSYTNITVPISLEDVEHDVNNFMNLLQKIEREYLEFLKFE